MTKQTNKKVCVVGAGKWGKNHIKTLSNLGYLGGIVEPNDYNLNGIKDKYQNVKFYSNIKEAVKENFDGFIVATPAETHFELAKFIIENGNHILVEKPIALNTKDARILKELAEKNKVNLMVGHVLLFHPAIRKIKQFIDDEKIGKLEYLYSNRLNLGTVRTEENILWSFAPHDISIFQYFIGELPEELVSRGATFLQPNIHDTTMTIFKYPQNIVAHIFVSWLHPFKEQRLVVIGSKGMLSFEDSSQKKELLYYEKGIDWIQGEPVKRDGATEVIDYENIMPLTEELKYFVEHLDGTPIQISNGQNGVDVLEILEQATESMTKEKEYSFNKQAVEEKKKDYFVHENAVVDDNAQIGEGTKIWHFSHVQSGSKIGKKCVMGQNVNIANNVTIGNFVKIQNNVSVYEGVTLEDYVFCGPSMVFTNILDPRCKYPQVGAKYYVKTLVKEGASLGANSTIVCGHTIGKHAFIAAGAVVAKDVPDYALMMGVPAKQKGWICECGEILAKFEKDVVCPRCKLKYEIRDGKLQNLK
jgi:UDP-2-acetamido-3-amino-2,3-dideoxy-glucuronate N-acetyltransferase